MGEWKQGIFGCFSNSSLCILTCCAMPLAIGKNAEAAGEASAMLWVTSFYLAPCIVGALMRGLIRRKNDIEGSFWTDCLAWGCVPCCALCQETAETGSLNAVLPPEMQEIERNVTGS